MNLRSIELAVLLSVMLLVAQSTWAEPYDGFTLYGRSNSTTTNLLNLSNTVVKTWTSSRSGGYASYLRPNGNMIRTAIHSNPTFNGGGGQGYVQEFDWNGTLVWEYLYSNSSYRAHHDIEPMANGNVLLIAWEYRSAAQAVQAGYDHSAMMWPDHIVEVQPTGANGGTIVWEWHVWDHLIQDWDATKDNYGDVGDHPELLDINMGGAQPSGDWMHMNGISYNPVRDEITFSSHSFNEIYVIDHSTTSAEAAGHSGGNRGRGGDILYRWGQPANYDAPGAQVFDVVHCAYWVPNDYPGAGNLMAFNNREGQGTSVVTEITPPYDENGNYVWTPGTAYGPASPTWTYTAAGFYSNHLGWCGRLPNGNTIISESTSGILIEVNSAGVTQWSFQATGEAVAVHRYGYCDPHVSAIGICPAAGLTIKALGNGDLQLNWEPGSGATEYRVYRLNSADDPYTSGTLVATVAGTSTVLTGETVSFARLFYTVVAFRP